MTLYDLTGQALQLMELAEEGQLDQGIINDTLEGVEFEIEEKADCYAKIISEINGEVDTIDAEIKRLTARKNTKKNNIIALKKNLEGAMITLGKTKFKTALNSFGIQKNPASVNIVDEAAIPQEFYVVQPPKLDKTAVKEHLKTNEVEWANLQQTESLRIR